MFHQVISCTWFFPVRICIHFLTAVHLLVHTCRLICPFENLYLSICFVSILFRIPYTIRRLMSWEQDFFYFCFVQHIAFYVLKFHRERTIHEVACQEQDHLQQITLKLQLRFCFRTSIAACMCSYQI